MTQNNHHIKLHYFREDIRYNDLLIIVSHPTIGTISSIVGNYLVEQLNLHLVGAFLSPDLPPTAIIDKDGNPQPPVRIYAGEFNDDPETVFDQVVVISSDLPMENSMMYELSDHIIDWAKSNSARAILTIEAINQKEFQLDRDIKVRSITTGEVAQNLIENAGLDPFKDGMVSGLTGLLQYKGRIAQFPVISILSEAHKRFTDARSAVAVLSKLNTLLPKIEIDFEPLLKKAEHVETQIRNSLSQITPTQDQGRSSSSGLFA